MSTNWTQALSENVLETEAVSGTGAVVTGGATAGGFSSINAAVGTGNSFVYFIDDKAAGAWECGIGTSTGPTGFTRDKVLASSAAGALVNFAGNTCTVWIPGRSLLLPPVLAPGDLAYLSHYGRLTRLPIGLEGQVLTVSGGIPSWSEMKDVIRLLEQVLIQLQEINQRLKQNEE